MNLNLHIKYLLSLFFKIMLKTIAVFIALIVIFGILDELEFFKNTDIHFIYPIGLSALNSLTILFEIFPFIFLISTQFFFIKLIENNELLVFKYSGLNNLKIIKIISIFSFILGLIIVGFFYNISSKAQNLYLEIKNEFSLDKKYLAVITENGIWIKDEINNSINIINAKKLENRLLKDIVITQYDSQFNYENIIESKEADISKKKWILKDVSISKENKNKNFDIYNFNSNFDYEKINSLFSNLSSLNFIELIKLRNDYIDLNYSTIEIDIHFNKLISFPFYLTLVTILASIIMFSIKFQKRTIFKILFGIFISVLIYYIIYFFTVLGTGEKIPVIISVWLPLLLISLICSSFLIRVNEK